MADLLERLLRPQASAPAPPHDDFWYRADAGMTTTAGITVTAENALQVSAFFAMVRVLAEDVAGLPLFLYRRTDGPDGEGKERATDDPRFGLLHSQPNEWQTSFEWRELGTMHMAIRGNGYNRVIAGPRTGFADSLVPLNPTRMEVEQLESRRLRYHWRDAGGRPQRYVQEEIHHVRGPSMDGIVGLSIIGLARNSMGLTVASEEYGARSFANDPHLSVVLRHPGKLTRRGARNIALSFAESRQGEDRAWLPAVLEEGMDVTSVGVTSKDAQFLETRQFQLREVARWGRMQPHKIGDLSDAKYANIEHQEIEHVVGTIRTPAIRWEQSLSRALLLPEERGTLFIEHLLEGLLRGDQKARFEAYQSAIMAGWMNRNEVRTRENLNPAPGLGEFLAPLNMAAAGAQEANGQVLTLGPGGVPLLADAGRARAIVAEAAATVIRREIAAVGRAARKHAESRAGFEAEVTTFYDEHWVFVARALQLGPRVAQGYVAAQRRAVLEHGIAEAERWEAERVPDLVALAIGAAA